MIILKYTDARYQTVTLSIVKMHKGRLVQVLPAFAESMLAKVTAWHKINLDNASVINVKSKSDLFIKGV